MDNSVIEFSFLAEAFYELLDAVPTTLALAAYAMLGGMALGLISAIVQTRRIRGLLALSRGYVLVSRAVPNMVLLYVVYFALPMLLMGMKERYGVALPGGSISAFNTAVVALALHEGGYLSEIFRAAMQSVDKGQHEAALAVGMSWFQSFRKVLLPQAIVFSLPLMASQFLGLIKSTSLTFSITVVELFGAGQVLSALTYRYTEVFLVTAVMYWMMSICFERLFLFIEHRCNFYTRKACDARVAKHP